MEFENKELLESVEVFQNIMTSVRNLREKRRVTMRQPILSLKIAPWNKELIARLEVLEPYFREEANVLSVEFTNDYNDYVKF